MDDTALRRAGIPGPDRLRGDRSGEYLLGVGPVLGVLWTSAAAAAGIVALSVTVGGWVLGVGPASVFARVFSAAAAVLLLFLDPLTIAAGSVALLIAVAVTINDRRRRS